MRRLPVALAGAVLIFAGAASAQAPTAQSRLGRNIGDAAAAPVGQAAAATLGSVNATAFVQNAARSDMYEIDAAKIALQRSQNGQIKDFANMMVRDHTMTSQMLMQVLPSGMSIPKDQDNRRSGMLDDLRKSKPGEFDKRYVDQQIAAHKEALTLMKGYADHGDNAKLKQFAAQTAPKIQMHLDMAQKLPGAGK